MTPSDAAGDIVPYHNRLLASMSSQTIKLFRPHLLRVPLVSGQVLHERGEAVRDVYFFECGLASWSPPLRPGTHRMRAAAARSA